MKLIEKVRSDRMIAFKAKENIKKNLLGCLISDSTKIDKEPSDEFVLSIIKKFIDNAKFVIEQTKETDYEFYQANQEIEILESYRPTQMTEVGIRLAIVDITEIQCSLGVKPSMKTIMENMKLRHPGQYDGKFVSQIAKEIMEELFSRVEQ